MGATRWGKNMQWSWSKHRPKSVRPSRVEPYTCVSSLKVKQNQKCHTTTCKSSTIADLAANRRKTCTL